MRYLDGKPLILDKNLFRADLVPGLTPEIASHSIYAYIEDTLGMTIVTSKRRMTVERATKEIGGPIAHGYLTLSLIPFLGAGMLPIKGVTRGINYGSDKVRFINMVRVGKRVRMRQKLIGAEAKASHLVLDARHA